MDGIVGTDLMCLIFFGVGDALRCRVGKSNIRLEPFSTLTLTRSQVGFYSLYVGKNLLYIIQACLRSTYSQVLLLAAEQPVSFMPCLR